MIYLFTDFTQQGPYIGELHVVLKAADRNRPVIDLMHDAPRCNPLASSYLLAALARRFNPGDAVLAVVDPGVGDESRVPVVVIADGITYVGPDNGLFDIVLQQAKIVSLQQINWKGPVVSDSFHGRDMFAPVLNGVLQHQYDEFELIDRPIDAIARLSVNQKQIIYVDGFGNLITGIDADHMNDDQQLVYKGNEIAFARTFSMCEPGQLFWYRNSMGLVEIAVNQQSAQQKLAASIGDNITIKG